MDAFLSWLDLKKDGNGMLGDKKLL